MKNKHIDLVIPEAFLDAYDIELPIETELNIVNKQLVMDLGPKQKMMIPYRNLGISALFTAILSFILYQPYQQIPLAGDRSIATLVALIGLVTGLIQFSLQFITLKKHLGVQSVQSISWRTFPIFMLSFGVLIFVGTLYGFKVLHHLFYNASFDVYTAVIMTTLFVYLINYVMVTLSNNLSPSSIIRTLTTIIIGGVSIAMITNKDQQWWLANFSFLGTPEAANAWEFNMTLMFSALLMIALIDYIFILLYEKLGKTKGLVALKILLILTAICLGGVGFFPYNDNPFSQQMHNRVAGYLVYLFLILIVGLRWLLPQLERSFLKISYAIAAMLVVSIYLFLGLNYFSLTAFELIAFALAFSWLLLLLQHLIHLIQAPDDVYVVTLSSKNTN